MPGLEPGIQVSMAERRYYVYVLASERNGTLYVGVTNDIARRLEEHRNRLVPGFTRKYGINRLVHCELFESVSAAIQREKTLKKWPRKWKLDLIESTNPQWRDLSEDHLW